LTRLDHDCSLTVTVAKPKHHAPPATQPSAVCNVRSSRTVHDDGAPTSHGRGPSHVPPMAARGVRVVHCPIHVHEDLGVVGA
jgi:hypothetical protein